MNTLAKSLLRLGIGIALAFSASMSTWAAQPMDWSQIPTTAVKLFHSGQSSYQWLRSSKHKRADKN
jgi:hypothetical protein